MDAEVNVANNLNGHPAVMNQIDHLKIRGVSVLLSDQAQKQQTSNVNTMTNNTVNLNNLAKGKQQQRDENKLLHLQQQHPRQQSIVVHQHAHQQQMQRQVQSSTAQSSSIKSKPKKKKKEDKHKMVVHEKIVSNNTNNNAAKRRAPSVTSLESLCNNNDNEDIAAYGTNTNKFALLSELDITHTSSEVITRNQVNDHNYAAYNYPVKNDASNRSTPGPQTGAIPKRPVNQQNDSQAKFCPPIILYNVDIGKLALEFKNKFPHIEIKFVNSFRFRSKLYIKGIQAYNVVMNTLKKRTIGSHSFTPNENKQFSIIIRGLHQNTSPVDVKADLDSIIPNVIADVRKFETPYMRKNNIPSDLFCVTLLPGKSHNEVTNVKFILFQKIAWEKPKASSKEVQCKRCQRWGHLAKNCNHEYQCVKCNHIHEPGQCAHIKSDDSQPYCVNCKQWGHPANFRGCESHLALLRQKKIRESQKTPSTHISRGSSSISPQKSFASLFKTNDSNTMSSAPRTQNSKLINDFLLIAKQLLEPEPISIETRIQNFLNNFKSLSNEDRKSECLQILQQLDNLNV